MSHASSTRVENRSCFPSGGLFGPNTPAVDRFLERLRQLGPSQWRSVMRQALGRVDERKCLAGLSSADALAIAHGRTQALDIAMQAARSVAKMSALRCGTDSHQVDLRSFANPAAVAAAAIVLADLLPRRHFAELYRPFSNVIEPVRLGASGNYGKHRRQLERLFRRVRRLNAIEWQAVLNEVRHGMLLDDGLGAFSPESQSALAEAAAVAGMSWDRASRSLQTLSMSRELAIQTAQRMAVGVLTGAPEPGLRSTRPA